MSASLEQSLDDIISSTRKAKKVVAKKKQPGKTAVKTAGKQLGKGVGKAQKKTNANVRAAKPVGPRKAAGTTLDVSQATKVVAHGLPTDLKQDVVKVC